MMKFCLLWLNLFADLLRSRFFSEILRRAQSRIDPTRDRVERGDRGPWTTVSAERRTGYRQNSPGRRIFSACCSRRRRCPMGTMLGRRRRASILAAYSDHTRLHSPHWPLLSSGSRTDWPGSIRRPDGASPRGSCETSRAQRVW